MFVARLILLSLFLSREGQPLLETLSESLSWRFLFLQHHVLTLFNPVPILVVNCKNILKILKALFVLALIDHLNALVFKLETHLALFYLILAFPFSRSNLVRNTLKLSLSLQENSLLLLTDCWVVKAVARLIWAEYGLGLMVFLSQVECCLATLSFLRSRRKGLVLTLYNFLHFLCGLTLDYFELLSKLFFELSFLILHLLEILVFFFNDCFKVFLLRLEVFRGFCIMSEFLAHLSAHRIREVALNLLFSLHHSQEVLTGLLHVGPGWWHDWRPVISAVAVISLVDEALFWVLCQKIDSWWLGLVSEVSDLVGY